MATEDGTLVAVKGGEEVHHFHVDASRTEGVGFTQFGLQRAIKYGDIIAASNEEGMDKYITWLADIYRNKPQIFNEILYEYWRYATQNDPLISKFSRQNTEPNEDVIRWATLQVDPTIVEPTTRNVPVRVKTAQTRTGSIDMTYYAAMVIGDVYSLLTQKGRATLDLQIRNLTASILAAIKTHIARVPLQETVCHYLSPKRVNAGMTLPRTVNEAMDNIRLLFNCFGKKQLSFESILARCSTAMLRRRKVPGTLILPISKQGALTKGRNERYLHIYAGEEAQQNLIADTGAETATDSLAGVELVAIPLIEATRVNNGTAKILTTSVATGSYALFEHRAIERGVEEYRPGDDSMGVYCWSKDDWVNYSLGYTIGKDLRFHQPGAAFDGFPNRMLLNELFGRGDPNLLTTIEGRIIEMDDDDAKEVDLISLRKVEEAFRRIHTTPPSSIAQRKSIDPLMVYDEGRQIWYPACVMGELSGELNDDRDIERAYESLIHVCRNELSEDARNLFDRGEREAHTFFLPFLKRIMHENVVFEKKNPMEFLQELSKKTPSFSEALALQKFMDGPDNEDISSYIENILGEFSPFGSQKDKFQTDFSRRTDKLFSKETNVHRRNIALAYLLQPICRQFFENCADHGIFIPLSGVIARFTEVSDMSTPVLTPTGQIGDSYVSMFTPITSQAQETKMFRQELGAKVGAAIPENDNFFPLMFAIGGTASKNRGGSGEDFMVQKLDLSDGKPIVSKNDPRLERWRGHHLNRPENCGKFTNLFFLQGSKMGHANNNFPLHIDIKGFYQPAMFFPFMTDSSDFREKPEQQYPGAAFNAWILDTERTFPSFSRTTPPEEFSYNQLAYIRRNNSMASRVETLSRNHWGQIEVTGGCHIRGARVPGALNMDMCLNDMN